MRPYRTPEQHREDLERAGWTIHSYTHHGIEATNPTNTIRMVVSFGSPPAEPAPVPVPTPRQPEPMPTTTAKQLALL